MSLAIHTTVVVLLFTVASSKAVQQKAKEVMTLIQPDIAPYVPKMAEQKNQMQGGGVSAPVVLYKVDPEYSEEARKAKYSGTVVLQLVVDSSGKAQNIHVVRSLGLGLDEKAIEAVNKWKFRPGYKGGQPVAVQATIEVNFRLL
jgi:TonB family protein